MGALRIAPGDRLWGGPQTGPSALPRPLGPPQGAALRAAAASHGARGGARLERGLRPVLAAMVPGPVRPGLSRRRRQTAPDRAGPPMSSAEHAEDETPGGKEEARQPGGKEEARQPGAWREGRRPRSRAPQGRAPG